MQFNARGCKLTKLKLVGYYYKVTELAFVKIRDSGKISVTAFRQFFIFQEETVMAGMAAPITLDAHETEILQKILRSRTLGKNLLARTQIVLAAS